MLLAIDTATPQVGVALWGDEGPIGCLRAAEGRRHGELLAPAIGRLVSGSGRTMADLTAVAVDVGPGLFTGLRVGLATAKALAAALALPAVGVTSLDVLAHPHRRQPAVVAAVVDARRHEVFRSMYRTEAGRLVEIAAPAVRTPADLAAELLALHRPVLAVGDGARRYADILTAGAAEIEIAGPGDAHPDPQALAEIAVALVAAGSVTDAAGLAARYLREADVRIGWDRHDTAPPAAAVPSGAVPSVAVPSVAGSSVAGSSGAVSSRAGSSGVASHG
jgi:tRNA threonylcarbamoyladenosine biosynthesis protein TsaB